jgi:two-component system KDP operon response regulator KdpE
MDGMRLIDTVRKNSLTPIIVLSARSNEKDKVLALDSGANDYVTKPFGAAELLARVRTTLRNYRHSADSGKLPGGKFVLKDLLIDYDARQVFIGGREIKLSQTEYNIVAFLSEHCGKMMTYSAIIKEVWGYPDEGSVKKLQVNMTNIRKKFGVRPGEARYITNELGVGYRMDSERDG